MARIERIERRLQNWARWSQERASHGLGYPRSSTIAKADGAPRHAEDRNVIPVDSIDAWQTEQAVRALRFVDGSLHALVVLLYVEGRSAEDIGRQLAVGARRVYQRLDRAQFELAKWFSAHRKRPAASALRLPRPAADDCVD